MVANIGISQPDYVLVKKVDDPPPGDGEGREGSTREDSGSATEGSASEGPAHPPEPAVEGGVAAAGVLKSSEVTTGHVRNGEVSRARGKTEGKSASEELLQPTLQALAVLSNVRGLCVLCLTSSFSHHLSSISALPSISPSLFSFPLCHYSVPPYLQGFGALHRLCVWWLRERQGHLATQGSTVQCVATPPQSQVRDEQERKGSWRGEVLEIREGRGLEDI